MKQDHRLTSPPVSPNEELQRFLENYAGLPSPQDPSQAATDVQIKNISALLAALIADSDEGTILDIGTGKGILLQRLQALETFTKRVGWNYVAVDFEENLGEILRLGLTLKLHRRVQVLTIDEFNREWLTSTGSPSPVIAVCRNVFHELDIPQTTTLISVLSKQLKPTDKLLVQDLVVLPQAERGNACWSLPRFAGMLERCGFETTAVDEATGRGNRWFTLLAKFVGPKEPAETVVASERRKQYEEWLHLESLVPGDLQSRMESVALLDLDLQVA